MKELMLQCKNLVKNLAVYGREYIRNAYYKITVKHMTYDVEEIFIQQNLLSGYNRLDTVVRYLAIEEYYGKNNYGFNLYKKMQGKRINEEYVKGSVERFRALIESWDKKGYNSSSEITLDNNNFLIDGSHRLALALYHRISNISCKVYKKNTVIEYGISWFVQNGFTVEEMKIIQDKCDELLLRCRKK